MTALASDRHRVSAAAGKCLGQALFRVEGFAPLIEDYLSEVGAELVLFARLLLQHRVAPGLERLEALIEDPGDAAVEPDRGARDALEQPAVVTDQDDTGANSGQLALQPLDTGQVEMVGRLV